MVSFATTTDEVKRIDLTFLRKAGYLCGWTRRSISWSYGDRPSGSVTAEFSVIEYEDDHYMELDYKIRSGPTEEWRPLKYRVPLVYTLCPFGGRRWWFICPNTRCRRRNRVLYECGDYFVCRKCTRLLYESQKYLRPDLKLFDDLFKAERFERNLKRRYYRGKPTRKYRKYLKLTRGMGWQEQAAAFGRMEEMLLGK